MSANNVLDGKPLPTVKRATRPGQVPIPEANTVPAPVIGLADAVKPICYTASEVKPDGTTIEKYFLGNAVSLGNGYYLTNKHVVDPLPSYLSLKLDYPRSTDDPGRCEGGLTATVQKVSKKHDLAIIKTSEGASAPEAPLRRSKNKMPKLKATKIAYLVGSHPDTPGKSVIPLTKSADWQPQWINRMVYGLSHGLKAVGLKGFTPEYLKYDNKALKSYAIDPRGLSGSAIVDADGKLITLTTQAEVRLGSDTFYGSFYGVQPKDIKDFIAPYFKPEETPSKSISP